jgi:uncharacterized Zn finger protein
LECRELRTKVRRGRVLARRRRVQGLAIRPGLVTATVEDDSGNSFSVRLRLSIFDPDVWDDVAERLQADAGHLARLVTGRIDDGMMEAFDASGAELFPYDISDVSYYCTCFDQAAVCTHSVAAHVALGDAMEADPFVLLELRGRDREWLLQATAAELTGEKAPTAQADEMAEPAAAIRDSYWTAGPIPHLAFRSWEDNVEDDKGLPVVRSLGPGPVDTSPEVIADVLSPLIRVAYQRLDGWMNQVPEPEEEEVKTRSRSPSLSEVLMETAHQQGFLTSAGVADSLALSVREARRHLQWLVDEGRLTVVGRTRGTRYLPTDDTAGPALQELEG